MDLTETEIDQLFAAVMEPFKLCTCVWDHMPLFVLHCTCSTRFTSKKVLLACSDETYTTLHVEICHGEGKYDFYYTPILPKGGKI